MTSAAAPAKDALLAMIRFLREQEAEVVRVWAQRVRDVAQLRELSEPLLIDHVPIMLRRLRDELGAAAAGEPPQAAATARAQHAEGRLSTGIDLAQVVQEYGLLRTTLFDLWRAGAVAVENTPVWRIVDSYIDRGIRTAAERYADARDQALAGLGRLSDAKQRQSGDAFLQTARAVLLESASSVEAAVILLRKDNRLLPHTASGGETAAAERPAAAGGPAGQAATLRRGILRRSEGEDFDLLGLPAGEPRMLYAVPLLADQRLYGVIEVAGRAGGELSRQDRALLESLAQHVSSSLAQRALRSALQLSEQRFRLFADSTQDYAILMLDPEGRISTWNAGAERILGFPAEEALGTPIADFFPSKARASGLPDALLAMAAREGRSEYEGWHLRKGGTRFWGNAILNAIRDEHGGLTGFTKITRDLSDRKLREDHMRLLGLAGQELAHLEDVDQTLSRFGEMVVSSVADWCAIDLVRDDDSIEMVALVHRDPDRAARGQRIRERYPVSSRAGGGARRAIETGQARLVARVSSDTLAELAGEPEYGEIIATAGIRSVMVVPLIARGRSLGAVTFVMSESDREFSDADLAVAKELTARAAIAIDNARLYTEAQRAIKLRENILAIVSHDLKSPLTAINLSAGLLLRQLHTGAADQPTEALLERIQRSGQQMERLIGDLLDMASIQGGQLAIALAPEPAAALIAEAIESQRALVLERGLRLRSRIDLDPQLRVCCDRARIIQVMGNLIGNAAKFTPAGGRIAVIAAAERSGRGVWVAVRDNGDGIPPEDQSKVFDAYRSGRRHRHLGTGLGLFISKGIIEAHGGQLRLKSVPGVGSTFCFNLRPLVSEDI